MNPFIVHLVVELDSSTLPKMITCYDECTNECYRPEYKEQLKNAVKSLVILLLEN